MGGGARGRGGGAAGGAARGRHALVYADAEGARAQPGPRGSVFDRLGPRVADGASNALSAAAPEFTPPGSEGGDKGAVEPGAKGGGGGGAWRRAGGADAKENARPRDPQQQGQGQGQATYRPQKGERRGREGRGPSRQERKGGRGAGAAPQPPRPGLRVRPPSQKRNTVQFTPTHARPDVRVVCGDASTRTYGTRPTPWDVVLVPGFAAARDDLSVYEKLLAEIEGTGRDDIFCLWHGDSHYIANDRKGWKNNGSCPTFDALIKRIEVYFGMTVNATRLNWYRDDSEWKPFHFDRAAFTPGCPQNFTVGISIGPSTRDIAFEHAEKGAERGIGGVTVSVPQPNGSMYAFSEYVNIEWRHGVPQAPAHARSDKEGRISIIAWGQVELDRRGDE